jgi:hypothetical protein
VVIGGDGSLTGAERAYLHEERVTLRDLQADLATMIIGFQQGKQLSLLIRNEYANPLYTTGFMSALFEQEGGDLFDVRQAVHSLVSRAATSRSPAWRTCRVWSTYRPCARRSSGGWICGRSHGCCPSPARRRTNPQRKGASVPPRALPIDIKKEAQQIMRVVTGLNPWRGGVEMMIIGIGEALITYGLGLLFGTVTG